MKRILLSLSFLATIGISTNAQTVLFTDSFDTYTAGGFLAQQATPSWTTWSNTPGSSEDATISIEQANSGTQSVKIANANMDIILPLGNKTSGKFNVSFYYYIPSGFGGYYNLQHFQAPGNEWANEVYFGDGGSGNIVANNVTTNFNHANDQWIFIENHVDIDNDTAALFIDGNHIVTWPFATQASGGAGTAQLGGVNFYGGAITGQIPTYYFDDVTFTELVLPLTPPTINVNVADIFTNGQSPESFSITNDGQQDMNFVAYPTYPLDAANISTTPILSQLTYDVSGSGSGVGYGSDVTVRAANKFTPSVLEDAIGQELTSVNVQIWDTATNFSLLVYDRGSFTTPGPGALLQTIPFSITGANDNVNVPLTSSIYIDGKDLWIGYVCDADSGTFPLGIDNGPRTPGVNWVSTGPGWGEYNATIDANLTIYGNLQGNPIQKWLTVSPMSGILTPTQSQQMDLTFNTTGLTPGNYLSVVEIGSNDPSLEYTSVNVHLTVTTGINDNDTRVGIMTYPNPTTNNINIKADTQIDAVSVYDMKGELIKTVQVNANTALIEVSNLAKGNYVLDIKTDNNTIKRNVIVQ